MSFKKLFFIAIVAFLCATNVKLHADDKLKFYGFVRTDMYYNSRQSIEAVDGIFNLAPKPIDLDDKGNDKNSVPQLHLSSITTRMGAKINGDSILGAKSSGVIEVDFGGLGVSSSLTAQTNITHLIRMRLAYTKLNWTNTELLMGQTWHPLFANMLASGQAFTVGAPFQPFSRAPMIQLKHNLTPTFSITTAAISQLQFASAGPNGASPSYLNNAIVPELFLGLEHKNQIFTNGIGGEVKTLKPSVNSITSLVAIAYSSYNQGKFQIKVKGLVGQNMTEQIMPWGYGITGVDANGNAIYTNHNLASAWMNGSYGKTIQVGFLLGYGKNLGTSADLVANNGLYTVYGNGYSKTSVTTLNTAGVQTILNNAYRSTAYISYIKPNFNLSLEYEYTGAEYGKLNKNGLGDGAYSVNNNRLHLSACYFF